MVSLLGLGMPQLAALRAATPAANRTPAGDRSTAREARPADADATAGPRARAVIYIFLSGGLAQHDSFDPKPDAPDTVRGEFAPIATATPGVFVCEHLPQLAARSEKWALVRSLTHPYNEHSQGHMVMLSGRTPLPPAFDANRPRPGDWPSLAAVAAHATRPRNNLPPAVVLPEKLVHRTGRVIPGQFAGQLGPQRDAWFVEAAPFNGVTYGAYPEYLFHHERGAEHDARLEFQAPNLTLPAELAGGRLPRRLKLLDEIEQQRRHLDRAAEVAAYDRNWQQAVSLLADPATQRVFDVDRAAPAVLDRYGRNSFGRSLLMAKQLIAAGVNLVQVNLGNNETWDTHQAAFRNLRDFLLPPTDRAVSALLDDLEAEGLLDSTLIVMAGEFGRTPRIFNIPGAALPGRDHWGAVQTVFFAGGGIRGGTVVGASDRLGGHPAADPHTPEQMAATIYRALGIPPAAVWHDAVDRPHSIYHGEPIHALFA